MDKLERIISECKTLAQCEEDLKSELTCLKAQLLIEEQTVEALQREHENLKVQNNNQDQSIELGKKQLHFLHSTRNAYNGSMMIDSLLSKLVDTSLEPTIEQQERQLAVIYNGYENIRAKYEASDNYQQLVELEAKRKELEQVIIEKNNEKMKLETELEPI